MKIIVAGSRSIKKCREIHTILSSYIKTHKFSELICGMAPGVDMIGYYWAREQGIDIDPNPAKWNDVDVPGAVIKYHSDGRPYNVRAGHDRNEVMAKKADMLIVFWDGQSTGTEDMIKRARNHNLKVDIYTVKINKRGKYVVQAL